MLLFIASLPLCVKIVLPIAVLLVLLKLYIELTKGVCKSSTRLDGKTVIITGANTGIGKETALDLAKRGAKVILACRDLERANKARDDIVKESGNKKVLVKKLDVSSLKSVRQFASEILKTEPRLDVLVNNAGCAGLQKKMTEDGLEYQMATNYFGHFLLTNLLLGLLKKSGPSRIVNVSSMIQVYARGLDLDNLNSEKKYDIGEIYTTSKLCQVLSATYLAPRVSSHGVTVNSLHPGAVETEIFRYSPLWVRFTANWLLRPFFKTSKEGAQTSIYLVVADEVANVTGKYFQDCKIAKPSKLAEDEGLAKKLWELSEQLVGLKPEERHF